MSRDRHRRLEELFHAALALPAAGREAFLADACVGDSELRAEVDDLLARDGDTLDQTLVAHTAAAMPERIGPYRIVRPIGEGGFAMVYLAEQEQPLRREVALKILKPGLDTRATLARFAAERQALAVMSHDGIARIHDAGATENGRPYFVMEYVPGDPITAYCDRRELDNRERLRLFAAVCDAVHHAHQKGVIHRDLKPTNILVTEIAGKAQVKVIDFGIAKATSPDLAEQTLFTQQGQIIGTPEYMSPEQAGFGPGDVDTRTDIYSLGVVLYELLAGVPPFSRDTLKEAGFAEIQRIIREVDPPRPSTRVSTLGDASEAVAKRHRTAPRVLVRQLRGELDWVVLKAMEKDRERRYASPAGLAADIQRFLGNEPLVARPPSVPYRLRKFARRNKLALAVAAALVLGLVGLSAGVTVALVESNRQRDLTSAALAETRVARDEAEAVTDFLVDMIGAARPYQQGRDVSVRAVLDSTVVNLDAELGDRPLIATRVRRTIGAAYVDLGLYEAAEALLERALADHRRLLGPDHPQTLRSLEEICNILMAQDRNAEAEARYRELLTRQRRMHGERHPSTLAAVHQLGNALVDLSRYAEAESLLVASWEGAQGVLDPDSQMFLSFASNLANFYAETGRFAAAEPLVRQVLEGRIRVRGEEHPEVLESWNNLAMLYADQGRYEDCIPFLTRAHELQDRLLGPEHPEALITRNNLAAIHGLVFEWAAAESLCAAGLALAREHRGAGERITQHMINNLGYLYLREGRFEAAERLLREAHDLRRRHHGEHHRDTYVSMNNLGELALLRGDLVTADAMLTRNLAARRILLGDDHPHTVISLVNLGRVRAAQGRPAAADSLLAEAFTRSRQSLGAAHRTTVFAAVHLGRVRLANDRCDDVVAQLGPMLAVADTTLVAADPLRGALRTELAACALRSGRLEEARDLLAAAGPLVPEHLTAATPWRRDYLVVRAELEESRRSRD